jgi:hypothetical protein
MADPAKKRLCMSMAVNTPPPLLPPLRPNQNNHPRAPVEQLAAVELESEEINWELDAGEREGEWGRELPQRLNRHEKKKSKEKHVPIFSTLACSRLDDREQ